MPTILLKKSDTASAVPSTANLTNLAGGAEVAVNTADKRMFTMNSSSAVVELGTNPSSLTLTGGTANGVLYLNGSKVATSGSALSFTGSLLKVGNPTNAPNTNLSGNLLQVKSSSGFSYLTMGNGDGADNNTYIGSASSITTFGTVTDAGATSELMRLTSTGLGIGTSSPAGKLDVQTASGSGNAVYMRGGTYTNISFATGIRFLQPASTLNANRQFRFTSGDSALTIQGIDGSGSDATDTNLILQPSGGNVGIGTSSPAYKLDVRGVTASGNGTITTGFTYSTRGIVGTFSNHDLGFLTNGTEKMFLDTSGNLGIGTTSPGAKLDVRAGSLFFSPTTTTANSTIASIGVYQANYPTTNQYASIDFLNGPSSWFTGGSIVFKTNGSGDITANAATERMRLDSSGNLGLGVTPSAWSLGKAIEVGNLGNALWGIGSSNVALGANIYYASGALKYANTAAASYYQQSAGVHYWYNATSGTAGNNITFTQAMTLNASGNLGVGITSPTTKLDLKQSTDNAFSGVRIERSATATQYSILSSAQGTTYLVGVDTANAGNNVLSFGNSGNGSTYNERARISAAGGFSVGTTADPGAGAIFATGNITAYYSDARLKDFKGKIGDALNKVSQLNGYYYTENEKAEEFGYNNKELQVGVSAQEVQAVLPEVVSAAPFDLDENGKSKSGDDYMTVNYEKLVPLLIEAIKELKAEVEALKAGK